MPSITRMMNDFGYIPNNVVVSLVQLLLKINYSSCDVSDRLIDEINLNFKLILYLFRAQRLMDILLQISSVFVILINSTRFLVYHANPRLICILFSSLRFFTLFVILDISVHHAANVIH